MPKEKISRDTIRLKDFSGILFKMKLPTIVPAQTAAQDKMRMIRNWLN